MGLWQFFRFEPQFADPYTHARLRRSCLLLINHLAPGWKAQPKVGAFYTMLSLLSKIAPSSFNLPSHEAKQLHQDLKTLKYHLKVHGCVGAGPAQRTLRNIMMAYDFDGELPPRFGCNSYPDF